MIYSRKKEHAKEDRLRMEVGEKNRPGTSDRSKVGGEEDGIVATKTVPYCPFLWRTRAKQISVVFSSRSSQSLSLDQLDGQWEGRTEEGWPFLRESQSRKLESYCFHKLGDFGEIPCNRWCYRIGGIWHVVLRRQFYIYFIFALYLFHFQHFCLSQ